MDKDHIIKHSPTLEVVFCIGSKEGYHGPSFTKEQVLDEIGKYQCEVKNAMPVKVSEGITFINKEYREDGFEISAICYPNSQNNPHEVYDFSLGLAEHLLYKLKQNRITVRVLTEPPDYEGHRGPTTIMLERENAEKTHRK